MNSPAGGGSAAAAAGAAAPSLRKSPAVATHPLGDDTCHVPATPSGPDASLFTYAHPLGDASSSPMIHRFESQYRNRWPCESASGGATYTGRLDTSAGDRRYTPATAGRGTLGAAAISITAGAGALAARVVAMATVARRWKRNMVGGAAAV